MELRAHAETPQGPVDLRFVGVDGPRWFLRVVVNGPAAADDAQMAPVLSFVRSIVVRRGDEPRPPREVLELTAPQGVLEAAAKQAMIAAARRCIVLTDHSKVGIDHFSRVAPLRDLAMVITDTGLDPETANEIEAEGPEVVRA